MSIVITLEPDVEEWIVASANMCQMSIEDYVNATLRDSSGNIPTSWPQLGTLSGAEMLDFWRSVGALNRQDMTEDSVEYVQRLRRNAELRQSS